MRKCKSGLKDQQIYVESFKTIKSIEENSKSSKGNQDSTVQEIHLPKRKVPKHSNYMSCAPTKRYVTVM